MWQASNFWIDQHYTYTDGLFPTQRQDEWFSQLILQP
jgi:hypothetical protein